MALIQVENLTVDRQTERLPQSRPLIIVGALPHLNDELEQKNHVFAAVNRGYIQNIQFVAETLGFPSLVSTRTGMQEADISQRRAPGKVFAGWNHLMAQPPFPTSHTVFSDNVDELVYPKNITAAVNPHFTITQKSTGEVMKTILSIDKHHQILIDEDMGVGGRYVGHETGELVFVAMPHTKQEKVRWLKEHVFADRTMVSLPYPKDLHVVDRFRVEDHIDQFIAHPLPLANNQGYLVTIDERYAMALDENNVSLPNTTDSKKSIEYVRVPYRFTSANYLLNTVASPTGEIFIEPELAYFLKETGKWDMLDHSTIKVLPSNTATNEQTQGGFGCKVVILAS